MFLEPLPPRTSDMLYQRRALMQRMENQTRAEGDNRMMFEKVCCQFFYFVNFFCVSFFASMHSQIRVPEMKAGRLSFLRLNNDAAWKWNSDHDGSSSAEPKVSGDGGGVEEEQALGSIFLRLVPPSETSTTSRVRQQQAHSAATNELLNSAFSAQLSATARGNNSKHPTISFLSSSPMPVAAAAAAVSTSAAAVTAFDAVNRAILSSSSPLPAPPPAPLQGLVQEDENSNGFGAGDGDVPDGDQGEGQQEEEGN